MQTIPVFVYLIPVALLFGPGNTAAFVATVVYAIPPTARLTELGIRTAAPQVTEAASSLGMTRRQLLVKVQLPLSRAHILAGVNQTVMAAMAMAIIAAMIGAAGLGQPVWRSLGRLEFGAALEGGLALVFMAVILDRVSASVGAEGRSRSMAQRVGFVAPVILSVLAALSVPSLRTLSFTDPPELMQASLRIGVDRILTWLNLTMGEVFDLIADTVVRFALAPLTDVLVWIPWPIVLLVGFVVGHVANGWRGGLLVVGGLTGIGLLGGWAAAAETVSIVGVAVAMAILFGVPLGVLMSQSDNLARLLRPVLDIMQTLPIFLFVLPAVIIFGAGSMAGVLATMIFCMPPMVRLTNTALREADPVAVEAVDSLGGTWWQTLKMVRLPLGVPTMLIGLNQAIMLALAMVVVSAFVGAPGLGATVLTALSRVDLAAGVNAGLCMLLLAVLADRVTGGLVRRLKVAEHLSSSPS